jgi:hypothetical protein
METLVLRIVAIVAVAAGTYTGLGASPEAAALPAVRVIAAVATPAPALVEETGWRRQWRHAPYGPVVVVPNAGVVADPEVDVEVDVEVDAGAPAIIVLPPPRPSSCGQYRYWNGVRCVDARYNDPYLGPR